MAGRKLVRKIGAEYFKTISTMLTSAFGLVAALAWNELVKAVIVRFVDKGSGVKSHLIYALAVTALAVAVTGWLAYWAKKIDAQEEEGKR
jgi:hypothetical protein